jgi:hypothetical protein
MPQISALFHCCNSAVEVTSALCVDISVSKDEEQECVLCFMCYESGSVGYMRFMVVTVVDNEGCFCLRHVAI